MEYIKAWIYKYILKVQSPSAHARGFKYHWDYLMDKRKFKKKLKKLGEERTYEVKTTPIEFETLRASFTVYGREIGLLESVEDYARDELAWKLAQNMAKYLELESSRDENAGSITFKTTIRIGGLNVHETMSKEGEKDEVPV